MSLTGKQHGKYEFLWKDVCAALGLVYKGSEAEQVRLTMHAKHGLPASRTRWGNEEFDTWKRECLAISEPANLSAQLDGLDQERIRRRHVVRTLLAKIGRNELYLPELAKRINLAARRKGQITRTFETMTTDELDRLIWELRRDARLEGDAEWLDFTAPVRSAETTEPAPTEDNIPF